MGCFSSVSSWRHQLHSSFSWTKKKQNRSSSACNLFPGYDACLPLTSEEHSKFLYVVGMNGKTGSFKVYESKKCESVSRSVVTLCSIMNYSPPGFCVHGILQETLLEWVAIPFFRRSFQPRDQTDISCIAGRFFTVGVTREAQINLSAIFICNEAKVTCTHLIK